jgi:hypothetical protein
MLVFKVYALRKFGVIVVISADAGTVPGVKVSTFGNFGASGLLDEIDAEYAFGLPLLMNVLYQRLVGTGS